MFKQMRACLLLAGVTLAWLAALALVYPQRAAVAVSPQPIFETTTTTIISGASLGAVVNLGGARLAAITMPGAWTAANLTLQASDTCTSYYNVYNAIGQEITVSVAAARYVVFSAPTPWEGVRCVKFRSGTSGSAVNQGGDRTITLTVRYEVK